MAATPKSNIAGWAILTLLAGVMIFAGTMKLIGQGPAEQMADGPIANYIQLIAIGEIATALLLLIPRTQSLGVLLASSFWGGAIMYHMMNEEPYGVPALLLILSWLGAYLRDRAVFGSFTPKPMELGESDKPPSGG